MASHTAPTVDISVLVRDWSTCYVHVIDLSSPDEKAASAILRACVTTGFFYGERTTGPEWQPHKQQIIENQWQQNRAFFDLPLKEKLLMLADSNGRYDAATVSSQMIYCHATVLLQLARLFSAPGRCTPGRCTARTTLRCMLCRGYTPFSAESLDPEHQSQGDTKEGAYATLIGNLMCQTHVPV